MPNSVRSGFSIAAIGAYCLLTACSVGPEYAPPDTDDPLAWDVVPREDFLFEPPDSVEWWRIFEDPALTELVELAQHNNNNVRLAGLRVLESRAVLGIATGSQWPQTQVMAGDATAIQASKSNANTGGGGDLQYTQYNLGAAASWEIDFWGKFRRGVEAADAGLLASIASYDDALVLLAAQVANTYTTIRTTQEQLRLAKENLDLQKRSYDIVDVLYRYGASNELDVQQAETLLLGTEASIPGLEITLAQAKNALSVLLGMPPGNIEPLIAGNESVPAIPDKLAIGIPADLLRQRPDVRRAEFLAMAQTAQVGIATANLYPSFSIAGSLGVAAAGNTNTSASGGSGFEDLFRSDSITYAVGPSFVWPFLNYGRIKNNVRVEDARLQQSLVSFRETVIQAAREVEDSIVAYEGSQRQDDILGRGVESAKRSSDLSMLRYKEGFADYQRVLDAQQRLFTQQQRYVSNKGFAVQSVIALYRSLGGGWQNINAFVDEDSRREMEQRIDWSDHLERDRYTIRDAKDETGQ